MTPIRPVERVAYAIGALLVLSGLAHAIVLLTSGGSWAGPLSLRKPTTFGLSFGLTLLNVTLLTSLLPLPDRWRARLIYVFAAACVLETVLVSMQAWRGVPSHFNMSTPFDTAVALMLAIGGFTLVVTIFIVTIMTFRHGTLLPPALRAALQVGFVALLGSQIVGGVMIATGVRYVISGDPQRAFDTGGWLKPVHFVLMHGILLLPLIAWFLTRMGWEDRAQMGAMRIAGGIYAILVVVAIAAAFLA